MRNSTVKLEAFILVGLFILTLIIFVVQFGIDDFFSNGWEFALNDATIILSIQKFVVPIFLFVVYFIYLLRQLFTRFKNQLANWILLITTSLLAILHPLLAEFLSLFLPPEEATGGWVAYPPLSALKEIPTVTPPDVTTHWLAVGIESFQVVFVLSLLGVALIVGRKWGIKVNQSAS
ncbi:MAG: hypothetical protein ACPGJS_16325 [Flammeovirgaceae bacterium]